MSLRSFASSSLSSNDLTYCVSSAAATVLPWQHDVTHAESSERRLTAACRPWNELTSHSWRQENSPNYPTRMGFRLRTKLLVRRKRNDSIETLYKSRNTDIVYSTLRPQWVGLLPVIPNISHCQITRSTRFARQVATVLSICCAWQMGTRRDKAVSWL